MTGYPYMPIYVGDYLRDTQHLSTEQHGAYLLLLLTMWSNGGTLPNDPTKLARIARVNPRRWHLICADVMAFFQVDEFLVSQKRLLRELQKATSISEIRSASGKAGVKAKALKNKEPTLANGKDLLEHASASPEPKPDNPPSPPLAGGILDPPTFDDFRERWPSPEDCNVLAEDEFLALSEEDRRKAVDGIAGYEAVRERTGRARLLARKYLERRAFDATQPKQQRVAPQDPLPGFPVMPGTPQWGAWLEHFKALRATQKAAAQQYSLMISRAEHSKNKPHRLPKEWPPGREPQ